VSVVKAFVRLELWVNVPVAIFFLKVGLKIFFQNVPFVWELITKRTPYRIAATDRTVWVKQEIPQTVCYHLVVFSNTVWL